MNDMMETIKTFDGKKLPIRHIPGPEGVRGRNSDNELILEKLGWEPTIRLADGLKVTYFWIKGQLEEVSAVLLPSHSSCICQAFTDSILSCQQSLASALSPSGRLCVPITAQLGSSAFCGSLAIVPQLDDNIPWTCWPSCQPH